MHNNIVKRYFSPNNIELWAQQTLGPEEFAEYTSALAIMNAHWTSLHSVGKITTEPLYENFFSNQLNSDIDVIVGEKHIFAPGSSITGDCATPPEYMPWILRYFAETGGDILVNE